jgi:hypothetical protein
VPSGSGHSTAGHSGGRARLPSRGWAAVDDDRLLRDRVPDNRGSVVYNSTDVTSGSVVTIVRPETRMEFNPSWYF